MHPETLGAGCGQANAILAEVQCGGASQKRHYIEKTICDSIGPGYYSCPANAEWRRINLHTWLRFGANSANEVAQILTKMNNSLKEEPATAG